MTRCALHAWAFVGIAASAAMFAMVCPSAAAAPFEPPDLTALEFAPSLRSRSLPETQTAPRVPDPPLRSVERTSRDMLEVARLIAAEQQREGQFSLGLRSYLVSLATLYQELGEHVEAIAALEKARQLVRVNSGLSSLNQVEMRLLQIESLEALGRRDAAALERNGLVELARKHPADLRVGAIYAAVADARVAAVERWLANPAERPIIFGSGPSGRDDNPGTTHALLRDGLTAAQMNYVDALRATALNGSPGGPDVYALERALRRTFYIQAQHPGIFFGNDVTPYKRRKMLDQVGKSSYERSVKYSALFRRPAAEIASLLIELGDWHLLFHADDAGAAAYDMARQILADAGASNEEIDALFTPLTPVPIPVFAPQLIDPGAGLEYAGYIDAVIELDGYGRSEDVRFGEQSMPAQPKFLTSTITARLKKHIAGSQFRPHFVNGVRTDGQRVALRYYFKY